MKKLFNIFIFLSCVTKLFAQDPQFTQFYANPLFLNPAFTGLTYEHRFAATYRNQWPGIKKTYTSYMASYDYNASDLNSGIGVFALQDVAGTSNFVSTQGGLNFAYRVKTGKASEARGGVMLSFNQKKIDDTRLIFNDQFITGSSRSLDILEQNKITYFDMGVGALFNSRNYWGGMAVKHINQPNVSMTGNIEVLPIFFTMHGGYRYVIKAMGSSRTKLVEYVSLSANYRHEAKYDQFDIGGYYFNKLINVGLWYRGLPYKKYKLGYPSREGISILVGLEIPERNLRIGYSYDITISRLGFSNTVGAHEVTIVYEVAQKRKRNKRVLVTCPKF